MGEGTTYQMFINSPYNRSSPMAVVTNTMVDKAQHTIPTPQNHQKKKIMKTIAGRFEKLFSKHDESSIKYDSSNLPTTSFDNGLEFNGLKLPDSFDEFVTCGVIFFNLERIYIMVSRFVQARLSRGNDHGVKAQVPFVVLTCNGKTRTSFVKLQTLDTQWNEEPPSLLDVEVFDFDGPFGQPTSLGHAEIRFLRHTFEELFPFFCVFSFCKQVNIMMTILLEWNHEFQFYWNGIMNSNFVGI
ncbi:unnamed protein product [Lactuca saligna]|uniref:C2 domain-containing protein n=1 Tax=Lactuca saligna TaxID=75948 RepID=A0AA35YI56_LACSI|nr:unnamed protein product [Lactuca saligna]